MNEGKQGATSLSMLADESITWWSRPGCQPL